MPSKQLTATVKLNTKDAEQKLRNIATAIDRLNKVVGKQSNAYAQVDNALKRTTRHTNENKAATDKWANSAKKVNNNFKQTGGLLSSIKGKLTRLADTYLGVMGTKAMVNASDTLTSAENKLNYVSAQNLGTSGVNANGTYSTATLNATQDALDKMYASSQKVRMSYADMMGNVSKSMALAGDAFKNNTDNAIRFQEIMAEAYAIGGASAAEMSSSMYQLIQALGSGTLAGDELRSVREGAPLAYKAIEQFAQGVYNTEESLKDLASQGKITSDMVIAAVMNAGNEMDSAFAQTQQTFAQTWDQIKNAAMYAFKPVATMLRNALNTLIDNGFIQKVQVLFANIAKAIMIVFQVIGIVATWVADNWNWLKYVVGAALIVITWLFVKMATMAIWSALVTGAKWLWANKTLIIIAMTIMALIYVWQQFKNGVISACEAIVYALLIVGAAILFIGILTWSLPTIIIGAVFILLAIIFMFFEQVCGGAMWLGAVLLDIVLVVWNFIVAVINFIIALVLWCGATLYNIFVACFNSIMQAIYAIFVDPIAGIIEWFVNAFNGGFNGILGAAANAIGQLVSMFLSGLKVITNAIDAVAGTSLSAKITGWQDSAKSWGKNSSAVTYKVEAPQLSRVNATDAFTTGLNTFDYASLVNPMDAYDTGAKWGAGVKDSINKWGSKFQNNESESKTSVLDKIGNKLGLDFGGLTDFPTAGASPSGLGGTGGKGGLGDLGKNVGKVADNTDKISDSMDLTNEDLEYLRRIADMEWKKEYTTASINIDMSNYNTVNGNGDLDGIVTKLVDKLYEEMSSVANGVYA